MSGIAPSANVGVSCCPNISCSRTAPCKTFAGAISKTALGGEIDVLDPGGFGAVTITKAITIDGGTGSGWASIASSGVNGIIVNAGVNDKVILRHISINGFNQTTSPGLNGIRYLNGKQLNVEECEIFGFSQNGIDFSTNAGRNLYVKNTNFTNNTANGISVGAPTAGFNVVNVENVKAEGNGNGVVVAANCFATINNSSFFQNTTNGISAGASSTINVESSVFAHNTNGVNSVAGSAIRLSNATIYNNANGIVAGGAVEGFFNNRVFGNSTNGAVTHQTAQQ